MLDQKSQAVPLFAVLLHMLVWLRTGSRYDPTVQSCCLLICTNPAPIIKTGKFSRSQEGCMNLWATKVTPQENVCAGPDPRSWGQKEPGQKFLRAVQNAQGPWGNSCAWCLHPGPSRTSRNWWRNYLGQHKTCKDHRGMLIHMVPDSSHQWYSWAPMWEFLGALQSIQGLSGNVLTFWLYATHRTCWEPNAGIPRVVNSGLGGDMGEEA